MSFSVLSFLNAVFWFNLGLIPIAILQTRWKIAMKYSPSLLVALAILARSPGVFPLGFSHVPGGQFPCSPALPPAGLGDEIRRCIRLDGSSLGLGFKAARLY